MRLDDVDERDTGWEVRTPVVRAYFWTEDRSMLTCTDVRDATVEEATIWAHTEARTRGAELDLAIRVLDERGEPGLIWLVGDGVSGPTPLTSAPYARARA